MIALNDAGPSPASEPSEPVVVDVPGVRIAPYFVSNLTDVTALEHDEVKPVTTFKSLMSTKLNQHRFEPCASPKSPFRRSPHTEVHVGFSFS